MNFVGYSLSQLAVIFAVAGTAITGLYLLRMRRRQVLVPFAALWERVTRQSDTRRLWRRLRRLVSWLVQLLLLLLVLLALGDPRPDIWLRDPYTVAVVIDRSASMAGTSGELGTRIEAAKERAKAEIVALGPADHALVIAAGEQVEVAAPLSDDPGVLVPAIEALQPTYGDADLGRALALASHAVADKPGPRILLVTDGALGPSALAHAHACQDAEIACDIATFTGTPDNIAITAFAARRYPGDRDKIEVLAEVRNLGDEAAAVVLDVEAETVSVGRRALQLGPGEVRTEVLTGLDAARSRLVARLFSRDADTEDAGQPLGPAFDDTAYAVVPPLRPLDVTLVTDGTDLFLEAALLTVGDHVRLSAASPADDPTELANADLVVFDVADGPLPAELPETNVVVFDPWRTATSPCTIAKRKDVARPFLTEQDYNHPTLQDVVLKDINIARGTTLVSEPGDIVLARSLGEPIIVLREREHALLAVGFDPRQSDLALRAAFPLFVDNVVRYVEQRSPGFVAAAELGQTRDLGLADLGLAPQGVSRVRVDPPTGRSLEVPVERGRFRLRALVPGFYGVTALDGAASGSYVELAVNQASVDASDLHSRLTAGEAQPPPPPAAAPVGAGPLWTSLLLLVAVALAVEWATYHRRVTV